MQLPLIVSANRRLHCKAVRSSVDSEEVRLANANINDCQMDLTAKLLLYVRIFMVILYYCRAPYSGYIGE